MWASILAQPARSKSAIYINSEIFLELHEIYPMCFIEIGKCGNDGGGTVCSGRKLSPGSMYSFCSSVSKIILSFAATDGAFVITSRFGACL